MTLFRVKVLNYDFEKIYYYILVLLYLLYFWSKNIILSQSLTKKKNLYKET
jgi:hypothetical protein